MLFLHAGHVERVERFDGGDPPHGGLERVDLLERDLAIIQSFAEIVAQPVGTPLPAMRGPFAALADAATPGAVDARLRAVLDLMARRLGGDPLDIGLVADYLRRKEQETARLRLIARGTFYGVPREALVKELGDA